MKKAAFYTLGCKVNQYETEAMAELFADSGYEIKEFTEVADVYVINTCSVTNMGDRKSRQIIRRAKKLNPNAVIAVTGCYAQTAPDEVLAIEGVNLVLGTKDRKNIVTLVEELNTESNINHVSDIMSNHEFEELQIKQYSNRTRAFIKIQEGCNQFCSYCIIPYARGPVRSRAKDDVVREIKELAHNGFKEIILVGIHVASYGVDLGDTTLESLIMDVDKIDGVERIRLSSIEPMTLNQEFIDSIKDSKKLCHHFRIRFGFEGIALFDEHIFQLQIIFNDTIVYHGNFAVLAIMGMAVYFIGHAMGCPKGMTDTDMRGFFIILLHLFSETCQLPLYLDGMNPIMINGNTGRVIPTIFQFGQTVQQYGNSLIFTNISYDSAHKFQPPTFYSFVAFLLSGALTALFCKKACDPERKGEEHPPNFRYGKQKNT